MTDSRALEANTASQASGTNTNGKHESNWHALESCIVTLTLGILGSSVLPVPSAFESTGVLLGLLTCVVVAWANNETTGMMLAAARSTGKHSYEEISLLLGGKKLQRLSQISLILLLFGTLCGDLALLADSGKRTVTKLFGDAAPVALVSNGGRGLLLVTTTLVILPLCLLRRIRSIEAAATAGIVLVLAVIGVIVNAAFQNGFVGITSGDMPVLFPAREDLICLPGAFSVLGFAFYVQPMVLPLLHEMPAGETGVKLTMRACQIVILGIATFTYSLLGVFGAAAFGEQTRGDIMMNHLLSSSTAAGILDACVLLYLATAMIPINFALRCSLDAMIAGPNAPHNNARFLGLTFVSLASSLAIAMAFPQYAEKMFEMTGATAVCLVCYVIPVTIHLKLRARSLRPKPCPLAHEAASDSAFEGDAQAPLLSNSDNAPYAAELQGWWRGVAAPLLVCALGIGLSIAAISEAVREAWFGGAGCVQNT